MTEEQLYQRSPAWIQTLLLNAHALRIYLHRYGSPLRRALDGLERRSTWKPPERLEWQLSQVRRVASVAYARSSFWQQAFDGAGVRPEDLTSPEAIARLPVIDKSTLRTHLRTMLTARSPRRGWLHGHTSGTTGTPMTLWYDRMTAVVTNAVDYRHKMSAGMKPGIDWIGLLLGRVVVPPANRHPPFWRSNWVHRQVWFSAFHLADHTLPSYVAEIRRRRLCFLEGYPSTLYILARFLVDRGERLPLKACFSSSETLHPIQREAIETAFQCRLYDYYGLAERVAFASDCPSGFGKHVADDYGYLEVVDEAGNRAPVGGAGYLVGTSLHNVALPLLRYRTTDIATLRPGPCRCGFDGPVLADITTKAEDLVLTPDGRVIAPSVLTHPFKPFPQIRKSQIIQESIDELWVRIVPADQFALDHQLQLEAALRDRLGPGVRLRFSLEPDIPADASGKYRWVISRVASRYQVDWLSNKWQRPADSRHHS